MQRLFSTSVMFREVADSSVSGSQREVQREAAHVTHIRTNAKDPPPYGAQHSQDALWEGGNEALPPEWHRFKTVDGDLRYQDDTFTMVSSTRPLPGVRLDFPGQLVSGCEWYISPLGRSYFVNRDSRITSWRKPTPERPIGSLTPECIIEGHSGCIWSLAYLEASCNIMSTSEDGSIRQWKKDGESVGKFLDTAGGGICSMAVSPDETMVVSGSADGRLRLWNIRKGRMVADPWEGHNAAVWCLDWSPNALEIASGSQDGTIRRWNPNTGRQMAPLIETNHGWVNAVKYSPQGNKFTSGGSDSAICVWSNEGKLLIKIKGHDSWVMSLCWSKDGACIFSASVDNTIRKWRAVDGEELVVFRGHTSFVNSFCLSPNESHLVGALRDCSIRIWDLETNQPVGNPLLHDDELLTVTMSSDGKYIASAGKDRKIYVWSLEAALKQQGSDQLGSADDGNEKIKGRAVSSRDVRQPVQAKKVGLGRYGDGFWGNDTNRTPHHAAPRASTSYTLHWRSVLGSLRLGARPPDAAWLPDAPRSSPRESRHWNFNLLPVGNSNRTVDVAPGRKKDRYAIAPPTKAEVAAAMQRTNGNQAESSTQQGQPAAGVQASQERPIHTQAQGSTGGAEDISYEGVSCCGFFFGRRRPTSH